MDYRYLTDGDQAELQAQKLRAIEIEHARIALDVELAARVGITDGDQISQAKANLAILARQHAELMNIIEPPAEEEPPRAADNGQVREKLAARR